MAEHTDNYIAREFEALYSFVSQYAQKKQLPNLLSLLPVVREIVDGNLGNLRGRIQDDMIYYAHFHHSFSVCRMLIDLPTPVGEADEDIMLSSAVAHVFPEAFFTDNLWGEMHRCCRLSPEVFDMLSLIYWDEMRPQGEKAAFFESIREDKLAILVKLADQSHLIELLYEYNSWSARSFIHETRSFYFPLCIYAQEHYPDIHAAVNILMQKMQNISLGAEILLAHYEARENELLQDILELQEDNAALKRRIRKLQEADEEKTEA